MRNKITLSLFLLLFITALASLAQPSNQWTQKTGLATAKTFNASFSVGTKGYVCLSRDVSNTFTTDLWEYDPATNVWTQKANFPAAWRGSATGIGIGSKGYVGLGGFIFDVYADWWEYDPAANTWVQKASFPGHARDGATSFMISNKAYVGSGHSFNGLCCPDLYFSDWYQYDPATDTWTSKSSVGGTARSTAVGFAIAGKGYMACGAIDSYTGVNDFYEYNPAIDAWTQKTSVPGPSTGRFYAAGFAIDTKGYVGYGITGDFSSTNPVTDFWEYNPSGNAWTQRADLTGTNRYHASAFTIGTKGYMGFGSTINSSPYSDFWEYIPPCTITATLTAAANPSCNGGTAGFATYTASGGTGALSYSWSPSGGTGNTGSSLAANTYTCHISDANGCYADKVVTISQPTAVTHTVSALNSVSCNGGSNGSVTLSVSGGTPGYTYTWTPGGGNAATASNLTAGNYTCTIKDANLCTSTKSVTITEPATIVTSVSSQSNVLCNAGSTGGAIIAASGGTGVYTYSWTPSGGITNTETNLAAGTYTCTVRDANNCVKTQSVTITEPPAITTSILSQTNVSGCFGHSNGSASILAGGGTGVLNYLWQPSGGSSPSASGLAANTYTCYVTDGNSCTKTQAVSITQPAEIITSITSQTDISGCYGDNTGAASISASGGTGALTYSWTPGGATSNAISNLTAGVYTCTVKDANACVKIQTADITQPSAVASAVTLHSDITGCFGESTGAAALAASGGTSPYTYLWTPGGATTDTIVNLAAGTYTCSIQDANGCIKTQAVSITQPAGITTALISQNNVSGCFGQSNGSASISATGGTGLLSYNWLPAGGNAANANSLSAGVYTCTVTDANNCSQLQTVTITQPPAITPVITSQSNPYCYGQNTGSVSISGSGGTGSLSYLWAPSGATIPFQNNLVAGTYTCIITDLNNCTKTQLVTITQPPLITPVIVSQTNVSCAGGNDGSVSLTATGGTGLLSYSWSPEGDSSGTADSLSTGTYTCTITDANTCSVSHMVNIGQAPIQSPEICLVTVDSLANNNVIYWDKSPYAAADSFIIYRYDVISTTYLRVGAVDADSLSMFTDTARSIGGPNGGDPQYASYRYKLAIRDTCGSVSSLSPYHETIFIQQNNQNFSWNAYTIEGGAPVTGYQFLRDNYSDNNWNVLVNTAGLSTTDPNYISYPNGSWRVDALGFTCAATRGAINTSRSNIRSPTSVNVGLHAVQYGMNISVWPNPTADRVFISIGSAENTEVELTDVLGKKIQTTIQVTHENNGQVLSIDLQQAGCSAGVYFIVTKVGNASHINRIVKTQ